MSPLERITAAIVLDDSPPAAPEGPFGDGRLDEAERWAAALTQAAFRAEPARVGVIGPSESWRGGVGQLTPPETAPSNETGGKDPKGVLLRVDAGDLGELSFWLERGPTGIRVVVGADGRNAHLAVAAERAALENSLRAAGLPVQSVAIVPRARFGTALAESAPDSASDGRNASSPREQRTSRQGRRLKLFG
ncbi:MAG TPA: hypothetical protein VFZ53_05120 [Polyangiaceae bacterium]